MSTITNEDAVDMNVHPTGVFVLESRFAAHTLGLSF